jgi:parallel beta-helix repeat protein
MVLLAIVMFLLNSGLSLAGGLYGPAAPGTVEGIGTNFQIRDGSARHVGLSSSAEITLYMQSIAGTVDISMQATQPSTLVSVTLTGLAPGNSYYKYIDQLTSYETIVADADGIVSFSVDLTQPRHISVQEKHSTYFLNDVEWVDSSGVTHNAGWSDNAGTNLNYSSDNSAGIGTWDASSKTVVLVKDIYETIEWLGNGITLDGNGFTIYGSLAGETSRRTGINMRGKSRNTIKNASFRGCSYSMYLYSSSLNVISGNTFFDNWYGPYLQWGSVSNIVENNIIDGGYGGIQNNFMGSNNVLRNNKISNAQSSAVAFRMWATGCIVDGNTISNSNLAFEILDSNNSMFNNTIENNAVAIDINPSRSPVENKIYNNNFINNAVQVYGYGLQNHYDQGPETGGNYWSDWTGPDVNQDGIVDSPYLVYDRNGIPAGQDNFPWVRPNGWKNQAPIFSAVGEKTLNEYDLLQFTVTASDPDGNTIVSLYAENLPAGATFDAQSGKFSWRPVGTQSGIYIVRFFAVDDGTPVRTGQLDVVITVGEMQSPTAATEAIIETVVALNIGSVDVTNSYVANLGKVETFIADGKILATQNQIDAFIKKAQMDVQQGKISSEVADRLIRMANDVLQMLTTANN